MAECELRKIYLWLCDNSLSLNIKKTKYITFAPNISHQPTLNRLRLHLPLCESNHCSCPVIERVSSIRYLGVIIDQRLRWHDHISLLNRRLRMLIHKFYILRGMLSRKTLMMVYGSLAESLIRYCIPVWGGAFSTTMKVLQITQNTLLKIITKKVRRFPSKMLFDEANVLSVRLLFTHQCLIRVHKHNLRNIADGRDGPNTRSLSERDIPVDFFRKSVTQRSFFFFGPKFYNSMPRELRQVIQHRRFKTEVKKYILQCPQQFLRILSQ